jgi:predicted  nucleic acid-binding Zn-ribbon protein
MTPRESLWSRIGHWISPHAKSETIPDLARSDGPVLDIHQGTAASRRISWVRPNDSIDQMQHGYQKVLGLVETIQGHLANQNDRSDKVVDSLTDLARSLKGMPTATNDQAQAMGKVADQMEISNSQTQAVLGVLSEWPDATMAQKEALDSISTQLQSSASATGELSLRLQALDTTVATLGQATHEQIRTLQQLQRSQQSQDTQLVSVLASQTRRFTMLFVLALVLSLVALVAAGLSLFA